MSKHRNQSNEDRSPRDGKRNPRAKAQTVARRQQRTAKRAIQGRS